MALFFKNLRWPASLRARLLATYSVGMALSAALVGSGAYWLFEPATRYLLQDSIIDYASAIAEHVQFDDAGKPLSVDERTLAPWIFASLREELVLKVVDANGRVAYPADDRDGPLVAPGGRFEPSSSGFSLVRNGVAMHAATVPIVHRGNTWYVQFATSDRLMLIVHQSIGMSGLQRGIFLSFVMLLVVFMVTTHFTLKRTLSPLRAASAQAQRITPRTLDDRLHVPGLPSEIQPLVDAFNEALERLQHGFRTQQEFLATTAHELKTPLALIRAQLEVQPQGPRSDEVLNDVDRMARQVQQLLHLAEASELHNYRIECVDVRPTIQDVHNYMARVSQPHGVGLALQMEDGPLRMHADRGALFTLLKNLLENAIQHSPPGGVVTLSVSRSRFLVADHGPGVAESELQKIFERFWRGTARQEEGAGLGLSICQEIAAAHQWDIKARVRSPGLEVEVLTST